MDFRENILDVQTESSKDYNCHHATKKVNTGMASLQVAQAELTKAITAQDAIEYVIDGLQSTIHKMQRQKIKAEQEEIDIKDEAAEAKAEAKAVEEAKKVQKLQEQLSKARQELKTAEAVVTSKQGVYDAVAKEYQEAQSVINTVARHQEMVDILHKHSVKKVAKSDVLVQWEESKTRTAEQQEQIDLAEQEAKEKAEQEAKEKAEQEAKAKAEQEAKEKAEQEEIDIKDKAETEAVQVEGANSVVWKQDVGFNISAEQIEAEQEEEQGFQR